MARSRHGYAGPGCPACATPIEPKLWREGLTHCRSCNAAVEVHVFTPLPEPGATPLPAAGGDGPVSPCANHAGNRAEGSCDRCGIFICQVCQVGIDGRNLCPACFDRLAGEGALPSVVTSRRNWCGMALHLSLFSLIPFFGLLLAPAGLWAAVTGLRRNRATGERLSHTAGWIALVVSAIGLLISIGMILALIFAARRG